MSLDLTALKALIVADSSIAGFLTPDEIGGCCTDASSETGWAFPVSGTEKEYWIKLRAKRHCYDRLWTVSARKFKVDQLSLNQRFDHYGKIIEKMDRDYKNFMDENPNLFMDGVEIYKSFGTLAKTGLVYDIVGHDVTEYPE